MHSKNTFKSMIYMLIFSAVFTGCTFFIDEVKTETEVKYQEKTGSCVAQANDMLATYFDTDRVLIIEDQFIDSFASCYQDTLQSIVKNTKSGRANSDEYIPENIDGLIEKLHPDISIGLERMQFFFQVKSFLIGGRAETLTKSEMTKLQKALPELASLLKKMNPHRALIFDIADVSRTTESYAEFIGVTEKLQKGLLSLVKTFAGNQLEGSINLNKAGQFVISEFVDQNEESARRNLDLLVDFKNLVLNSQGERLDSPDFPLFIKQGIRTYKSLYTFNHYIKDNNVFTNLGHIISFVTQIPAQLRNSEVFTTVTLGALKTVIDDTVSTLTESSEKQSNDRIPFTKLKNFITSLDLAGYMDGGDLKAETLVKFIGEFSELWLGPGRAKTPDFTTFKVNYVQQLVHRWYDRQVAINNLFQGEVQKEISLDSLPSKLKGLSSTRFWVSLYKKVSTYHWDSHYQVHYRKSLEGLTLNEMSASNSIALMAELFMKPYNSSEPNFLKHKVTIEQAQDIYEVVRILGVELAFMDARVIDSGKRSFGETNNFSTQLRNDTVMDYYEGFEYLAVALSSGRLADRIHGGTDESYHLIHKDVNRRNVIDASYFRRYLSQNFSEFFGHFKVMNNFWENAKPDERKDFLESLEYASRAGVISEKAFDLGELRVVATILSYAEAIFYNFDRNADGIAESNELREAEKHFRNLIKEFILKSASELLLENKGKILGYMYPEASEGKLAQLAKSSGILDKMALWLSPKIFIYLLNKGTIPKKVDWTLYWLLGDKGEESKYRKTKANALDVLRVFSELAKVSHQAHVSDIEAFLTSEFEDAPQSGLLTDIDQMTQPTCLSHEEKDLRSRKEPSFCKLSRLMFCNEDVNKELYAEMLNGRYEFFPEKPWNYTSQLTDQIKRAAVVDLMKTLEGRLRNENNNFAFQCSFPQLGEEYGESKVTAIQAIRSYLQSNETEPAEPQPVD